MNGKLWLAVFFFSFAVAVVLAGWLCTKDLIDFIIAVLIGYMYGLVGLLSFALGLRDKLHPELKF